MSTPTWSSLIDLGLVHAVLSADDARKPWPQLCDEGAFLHSLSLSTTAAPDEVLNAVMQQLNIPGEAFRVLEITLGKRQRWTVMLEGHTRLWLVRDSLDLVETLSDAFEHRTEVRADLYLGEWERRHQIWTVPKPLAPDLAAWVGDDRWVGNE